MGVDIYLNSVWKPFFAEYERHAERRRPSGDPEQIISETYEAFRSSGGYFRNAYNSSDIMWAMGLSWRHVQTMLDAEHRLPIERARDLLALIETRPLTKEVVANHFLGHMTNGRPEHPVSSALVAGLETEPMLSPDFEHLFAMLTKRRDELIALLRKSIELDEPLECSL